MKKTAEMLKEYVEQNPLNYGEASSVLDVLFWHYAEYGSLDSETIKDQFNSLRKLVNFPPKEYDKVFDVVSDLCLEHGRLAFREGMRFGILLMSDMNDK